MDRRNMMANAPGWLTDPERPDQERYWNGSAWTDRVRPPGRAGSLHLAEHVPHLQRALAASTADIDAVEDRLSKLFERSDGGVAADSGPRPAPTPTPTPIARPSAARTSPEADDDEILDLYADEDMAPDDADERVPGELVARVSGDSTDIDFAELDAVLAAEEPDEPAEADGPKRRFFRRS